MKPLLVAPLPPADGDVVWIDAKASASSDHGRGLTISQMAEKFGVTPRALRFYESKHLLKPAREGRGRIYSQADQHHVALILKGRKLGFTIAEIGQMIAAEEGQGSPQALKLTREKCVDQIAHLEQQLHETTEALAELRRMHIALCRA
jgi:DNA-binding transcriptional MerR regulator